MLPDSLTGGRLAVHGLCSAIVLLLLVSESLGMVMSFWVVSDLLVIAEHTQRVLPMQG
jgi:hypothetical protein